MRSENDIHEQIELAQTWTIANKTDVLGSYEEGVYNALKWALKDTDKDPIEVQYWPR